MTHTSELYKIRPLIWEDGKNPDGTPHIIANNGFGMVFEIDTTGPIELVSKNHGDYTYSELGGFNSISEAQDAAFKKHQSLLSDYLEQIK